MNVRRKRGLVRGAAVAVLFALTLAWAVPAHALLFLWLQDIHGNVYNTTGIKGIIVEVAKTDGTWVGQTVTDASGNYSIGLPSGSYTVKFMDPHPNPGQVYATRWFDTETAAKASTIVTVTAWPTPGFSQAADEYMSKAVSVHTTARRAGHPLTKLPGMSIVVTHKDTNNANNFLDNYWASTGGDGSGTIGGMPHGDFIDEVMDPAGNFGAAWAQFSYVTWASGSNISNEAALPLTNASMDVTVSVPAAKTPQKKNKAFNVTGKLSKRVTSPKKLTIVAKKGGTTKTFSVKITPKSGYSTYKGSIKLGKGTWVVWALFAGNSTLATTDSGSGRTIVVK